LISQLLNIIIKEKGKIMICTPSNSALDNLIEYVIKENKIYDYF